LNGFDFDPQRMVPIIVVGFFAIGLHEYAHCKFADMAGDPTPGIYGRVTLKLWKHFEPIGTVMMLLSAATGYGIGWGRPAPIDPTKMRNPRLDTFVAVAAGPISNLLQAVVWALVARFLLVSHQIDIDAIFPQSVDTPYSFIGTLFFYGVFLNLSLAFFNLFPIPPLDGHWLFGLLLPQPAQDKWFYYSRRYGWYILLGFVFIGQSNPQLSIFRLAAPVIRGIASILFGVPLQ